VVVSATTPGPWRALGFAINADREGFEGLTALGRAYGSKVGPLRISDEERDANALLMAAAPDLRDAVQATLDPIGYCDRTGQDPHEPNSLSKKLIAALTKAGRLW
jgi:hypothetical protein